MAAKGQTQSCDKLELIKKSRTRPERGERLAVERDWMEVAVAGSLVAFRSHCLPYKLYCQEQMCLVCAVRLCERTQTSKLYQLLLKYVRNKPTIHLKLDTVLNHVTHMKTIVLTYLF